MKVGFIHSHKFIKKSNQYFSDGKFTYDLWKDRYLQYFEEIIIIARITSFKTNSKLKPSSGEKVVFVDNKEKVTKLKKFYNSLFKSKPFDILIVRLPSIEGLIALQSARKYNIPVVIELVGDPFDAYWYHSKLEGRLAALFLYNWYKIELNRAKYIIFVTEKNLQKKYLTSFFKGSYTNISNVNISKKNIVDFQYNVKPLYSKKIVKIGLIGSYFVNHKGIDTAIKALKVLVNNNKNIQFELNVLGSGNIENYTQLIKTLRLEQYIKFCNPITEEKLVLKWLDEQDIYIQPSLTEGLPRALIEAMSRGKPVVATNVGGIPELLDSKMLISKKDFFDLAKKITELVYNNDLFNRQVQYNIKTSSLYTTEKLNSKRDKFWDKVKGDIL